MLVDINEMREIAHCHASWPKVNLTHDDVKKILDELELLREVAAYAEVSFVPSKASDRFKTKLWDALDKYRKMG